jgi:zinc protease
MNSSRISIKALLPLMLLGVALAPTLNAQQIKAPQIKYSEYTLKNGLKVILSVDHAAPVIAVSVTYNVGSRNERPGRTGFAHLFEHMMFQGSANVGKGEHMMLIQDNGGTMNGTTNKDRTNYFESLPANQLDLALFLESDRMKSLDISQATLDNQRAVVQEEKRQSYDNQPYGQLSETIDKMAYESFGYQHTTIGSMDDLNAATLDDVRSFFKTSYAPNNAVIAIAGDFNEGDAKKKVEKYFGEIPRQADPPVPDLTEHMNTEEHRKTITDTLARQVRYEAAYKTVSGDDPDAPALQMLGSILSRGRTGRLFKAITEKRIAQNANAGGQTGRGPGLFTFSATLGASNKVEDVERAFDEEIAKIQANGVTEDEVKKAKTQSITAAIVGGGGGRGGGRGGGGNTALSKANALSQNAVFWNDPGRGNKALERTLAVTAADIQRVAKKYLVKTNRVVVVVMPDSAPDDGGTK